ncbi:MAG: DegT/DnrJ/EryC1/StrS family aminotransferase [Endomicrobiaceae bacterium]|nr:DegT/DnrJ/EryC1/StrS family aminotransferase [Endomicrobiaceae bacterium]
MKNEFIPVCNAYLAGNEKKYVDDCLNTGWISSAGKYVSEFEKAFAKYCGCKYAVSVTSGTTALHLALSAVGIKQNDEVIIPSFTMIACAFAVCYTGAKPVFVDIDDKTWNIDTAKIEEKITKKTKAIMPVHMFGNPCNMKEIIRIAKKYKLHIIEDCAQAHGAEYNGKKVGGFSSISAFSFFANKNLTTGEGGMVLTNNKKYYDKCRYLRNMSYSLTKPKTYEHDEIGFNYRMTNLQGAIGLAQVELADKYKSLRIKNNKLYKKFLSSVEGISFQEDEKNSLNVNWMNTIVIDEKKYGKTKEQLINFLKENNVDTRLLFTGMDKQKSLKKYGCKMTGNYKNTNRLTKYGLYLPSSSNLKSGQIEYICNLIKDFSEK